MLGRLECFSWQAGSQKQAKTFHRGIVSLIIFMKVPEGMERNTSALSLISVLEEVGGQCFAPAAVTPGKILGNHFTNGWVDTGPAWTSAEYWTPLTTGIRSPDRAACRDSIYRLYYPGRGARYCTRLQTCPGAHPASCTMGSKPCFWGLSGWVGAITTYPI